MLGLILIVAAVAAASALVFILINGKGNSDSIPPVVPYDGPMPIDPPIVSVPPMSQEQQDALVALIEAAKKK